MHNILITQKIFTDKHNQINLSLEKNWFSFFKKKKINLIPVGINIDIQKKILALNPKGLILSGGNDLYSLIKLKENLIRDKNEIKLIKFALKNKIPILAVCRGFQLVAKFFKCKIFKIKDHVRTNHIIRIDSNFLGSKVRLLKVNSFHNYAINKLPKHFSIARCEDGSIEIAKSKKYKILCFMSHPERKNISQKEINNMVFSHLKIK